MNTDYFAIKYFKLVKKDAIRQIVMGLFMLILWVSMLVYGIINHDWIYLVVLMPTIITFFAIINDVQRLNNAEIFLNTHKETINE